MNAATETEQAEGTRIVILKVPQDVAAREDDYDLDFLEIGDEDRWLREDGSWLVSPPDVWNPQDEIVRYLHGIAEDELVIEDVTERFAPFVTDAPPEFDTPRSTAVIGRMPGDDGRRIVAVWRGWETWEREKRQPRRFSFERLTPDQLKSIGWPSASPYVDCAGKVATVHVWLDRKEHNRNPLYLFRRKVAERPAHNKPVVLGDGVSVVSGGFPKRGGSEGAPLLNLRAWTVLEIRDVPLYDARDAVFTSGGRVTFGGEEPRPESLLEDEELELVARLLDLRADRLGLVLDMVSG